jgi:hypothetical protein
MSTRSRRGRHSLRAAADVFGSGGGTATTLPAVDVKSLHAKIGELTLENDFFRRSAAYQPRQRLLSSAAGFDERSGDHATS